MSRRKIDRRDVDRIPKKVLPASVCGQVVSFFHGASYKRATIPEESKSSIGPWSFAVTLDESFGKALIVCYAQPKDTDDAFLQTRYTALWHVFE